MPGRKIGLTPARLVSEDAGDEISKERAASESPEILNIENIKGKADLPPASELKRSPIDVGTRVFTVKTNLVKAWAKGTVSFVIKGKNNEKMFKLRLDGHKYSTRKAVPAKYLAYEDPASVIIPVGTRIIACYASDQPICSSDQPAYYAGVVAEPPKITNRERYLIFFDTGRAQYVKHMDICVVCAQSDDVADDLHENINDFVRGYLQYYPEIPMAKLAVGDTVMTEYNFKWSEAKVVEVDCSMVKILFITSNRTEWIYRGSTRLRPLRNEPANPEVHNLENLDVEDLKEDVVTDDSANPIPHTNEKKSQPKGYSVDTSGIPMFGRVKYIPHDCCYRCRESDDPISQYEEYPYLIPVILRWERQLRKYEESAEKQIVIYRSPCGRHLRNLEEIQNFLAHTRSKLTIDLFSFDADVDIFEVFRSEDVDVSKSYGDHVKS